MIERVQVTCFQSLKSIDLRFGRYTVIVGPSSSGKTALMRALRAVASNVRGTHVITRGQTRMAVTVHTGDHQVTLERDQTAGRYRIATGGKDDSYTKLAGGVPAAVTAALRIDPVPTNGTSVNFAGQFDGPYLLGESGANVARALGSLTNVDTILEAAREAIRRRNLAAADLRTREADLARVVQEARQYQGLAARRAALETAEKLYEQVADRQGRIDRCRAASVALQVAEDVLAQSAPSKPPDTTAFNNAYERWSHGQALIRSWAFAEREVQDAAKLRDDAAAAAAEAECLLHEQVLVTGICPTCNQPVTARNLL